jgi:hypothetical protein
MSYPVFLNAVSTAAMPDGSKNEWQAFFRDGLVELEANGWPPLLWMALFQVDDIRWARAVDDEDLDSEGRAEPDEFGDATYPYLVTSSASALRVLAARKHPILNVIGKELAPVVDRFEGLLAERFPQFVLCRTAGLVDASDMGPSLEKMLVDFDRLAIGDISENRVMEEMQYLLKQQPRAQPVLLVGTEPDTSHPVYAGMTDDDAYVSAGPGATMAAAAREPATPAQKKKRRWKSELLDWGCALVAGPPTALVYVQTGSVIAAVATFCVLCAALVLARIKFLK